MAAKSTKNNKKGNSKNNNKKVNYSKRTANKPASSSTDIHGIIGIVWFCLGILILACILVGSDATAIKWFKNFMKGLSGSLCLLLPALICWGGIWLVFFSEHKINLRRLICIIILFVLIETILQIFHSGRSRDIDYLTYLNKPFKEFTDSTPPRGGGFIGALLAWPLYMAFDTWGSIIILFFAVAIVLMVMTGITIGDYTPKFLEWHEDLKENRELLREEREAIREAKEEEKLAKEAELALERRKKKEEKARVEEEPVLKPKKKKKEPIVEKPIEKQEPTKLSDIYAELDKNGDNDRILHTEQHEPEPIDLRTINYPPREYNPPRVQHDVPLYLATEHEFDQPELPKYSRELAEQQTGYEFASKYGMNSSGSDTNSPYARPDNASAAREENKVLLFPQQEMVPSQNEKSATRKMEPPDSPVKESSWIPEDSDLSYGPGNADSLDADEQQTGIEPRVQQVEGGQFEPEYPTKDLSRSDFQYQAGNIGRADTPYQMPQNPEIPSEPSFVLSPVREPEREESPSFIQNEPAANETQDERLPVSLPEEMPWNAETHKEAHVEIQANRQSEAVSAEGFESSEPACNPDGESMPNRRRKRQPSGGAISDISDNQACEHLSDGIPNSIPARGFETSEQQSRGQTQRPTQ